MKTLLMVLLAGTIKWVFFNWFSTNKIESGYPQIGIGAILCLLAYLIKFKRHNYLNHFVL